MGRIASRLTTLLTACSAGSGILPAGPDSYTVTERRAPILGGAMKAKEVALAEANTQCDSRGAQFVPVSEREGAFPLGNPWGQTDYTVIFRCVARVNAANSPALATVTNLGAVPSTQGDHRSAVALAAMPITLRTAMLRPSELVKTIAPSVYVVAATNDFTKSSEGAAVAISSSQLITNCHVVANLNHVFLKKDDNVGTATLIGGDPKADKCFLETSDMKLVSIRGGRTFGSIEVGEEVFCLGKSQDTRIDVQPGYRLRQATRRWGRLSSNNHPIAPGSSGGGLFDARGNLVGITMFLLKGERNLNFAISADAFCNSSILGRTIENVYSTTAARAARTA